MDAKKSWAALSIIAAVVSLVVGAWGRDGAMIALSCFAVAFSIIALMRCSEKVFIYSLIMSATVLVSTILMVTIASYSSLVDGGVMTNYWWIYVSAAIHGTAMVPTIVMFFFTAAALFNASYNWVLMPGLFWMVGTGMQVPMYVAVYIVQYAELEAGIISNTTLVMTMFLNLILFFAVSMILRHIFKKNRYLVTAEGLKVRE